MLASIINQPYSNTMKQLLFLSIILLFSFDSMSQSDSIDVGVSFPGGYETLQTYIDESLVYPEISIMMEDQGVVVVEFVVEIDGSLSEILILTGVTGELDREAKRLVRSMPKWNPGEFKGEKVRVRCRLPIVFELTDGKSIRKERRQKRRESRQKE